MHICMRICMRTCTYACTYACARAHVHAHMHAHMHAHVHICMRICMRTCTYACTYATGRDGTGPGLPGTTGERRRTAGRTLRFAKLPNSVIHSSLLAQMVKFRDTFVLFALCKTIGKMVQKCDTFVTSGTHGHIP